MLTNQAYSTYARSQVYADMDPKQLILLLYKEVLKRLKMTKNAIEENNPCKRGENLGRAISIISELYSSLDTSIDTEEIYFLSNLYLAILKELPKVNLNNDVKIIDTTISYIEQLKKIWETTVMGNSTLPENNRLAPQADGNLGKSTRLKALSA